MSQRPLSKKQMKQAIEAWLEFEKSTHAAAKKLRIPPGTLSNRLARAIETVGDEYGLTVDDIPAKSKIKATAKARNTAHYIRSTDPPPPQFEFTPLPEEDVDIETLVAHRKAQFSKKRDHEHARRLIQVKINVPGPIAILHMGDPHVDDDGTDIEALEEDTDLVTQTEGMFLGNVGDVTNNWIGRLAHLYSQQSTSAKQAWKLAEWLIGRCRPLYLIGGNHDGWSGDGDPLKWITRQKGALYQSSECRLDLALPEGMHIRVNARHDHAGHSQWNPAHGVMKAIEMGTRDHISIAGHRHKSGYGVLKDPNTGITCHGIQVASYKIFDRYARDRGFRDQTISPRAVTVINTMLPETHPDLVKVYWDAQEAARRLADLRREWKRRKP